MMVPTFPVGALQERVLEWAEDIDSIVLMAKAGASFSTENMRLHEMNKDERDANMLHMGVILASLRAVPSVRATLKAEL